jgi:hypothetical protein
MEFKDYIEITELQEDINFINEGIGSTMAGIADAGVSGVGNFGKQLGRGLGNVLGGGIGAGMHSISSVFGSPKSREEAKSKILPSIKQIGRGAMQAAASPFSGIYRGYEAGQNPFSKMKSDDGSGWGEMLGLRSKSQTQQTSPQQSAQNQQTSSQQSAPSWDDLYSSWRKEKNPKKIAELLYAMKKFHREKYEKLKAAVKNEKLEKSMRILGFQKGEELSQNSLLQKYRQMSKKHHPDMGGSPEEFKKIQAAFEHLRDSLSKKAV